MAWIPNNKLAAAAGVRDSRADALAYLESLSLGMILPELAEALVDTGPELIDWLESSTPLRLRLVPGFPDYHPEHPGGKPQGGRSLEPELFSFSALEDWGSRMVGTTRPMRVAETPIGGGTGVLDPQVESDRRKNQIEGLGRALVGSLLKGCLDHGVVPHLEHRAVTLVMQDGAVTGVRFETPDEALEVGAHSVVVATGGFESDEALVRDFLRGPIKYPAGVASNTGDGLRMAMRVGAQLGNMREAWWVPVAALPKENPDERQPVLLILRERTLPRSIMVNRFGQTLHQRGHQLQRPGRRVSPVRPDVVQLPQPAVPLDLRPRLRGSSTADSALRLVDRLPTGRSERALSTIWPS